MNKIRAWHFLPDNGRIQNRDGRTVEVGKTYSCDGPLVICENGMHASRRLIDALKYAPGSVVCEVEVWGDVIETGDKLCGRHRKVLRMADATETLHRFACEVASRSLENAGITDKRSWAAIETKLLWLDGKATDEELSAAWPTAWSTAISAAIAAAWSTAIAAAWSTAISAAFAAAFAAARSAAFAVVWYEQDQLLTDMIGRLLSPEEVEG